MPRPLAIGVGPEKSDQLIAAQPGITRDGERREQRDGPSLRGGATHRLTRRPRHERAAKRMQSEDFHVI